MATAAVAGVGSVVPVVPNHVCPVVNCFEELVVSDTEGTTALQRWPVAAADSSV